GPPDAGAEGRPEGVRATVGRRERSGVFQDLLGREPSGLVLETPADDRTGGLSDQVLGSHGGPSSRTLRGRAHFGESRSDIVTHAAAPFCVKTLSFSVATFVASAFVPGQTTEWVTG